METQDILNKAIGTKETATTLKPAKVSLLGVELQKKKKDGTEMQTPLIYILCKHPDKPEEPIKISKIKCIVGDKISVKALWASLDDDGNISKSSAIAELLKFLKVENINGIIGKEIYAVEQSDKDKYLCLRAY